MATALHAILLFAAASSSSLVAATWQGVALAIGVGLCLRLLPGMTAAARSLVWSGALLLVVLLHFAPLAIAPTAASSPMQPRALQVDVRWSLAIGCLWALLSLIRGVQLIRSAIHLRRLAAMATPVAAEAARLVCKAHRRVEICSSIDVDRPCVAGFFSPRILIPPALLATLSATELEQIVLHEMEHLRRRDDWLNLMQKVILVLFPLNPALFWIERRLCVERELACDDGVLRFNGARKAYATCLAKLAEHSLVRRGASLALGAWERQSELAKRIHRILRRPGTSLGTMGTGVATGGVLLGVLAGAAALARSPQFVSFTPVSRETSALPGPLTGAFEPGRLHPTLHPTLVRAAMPESHSTPANQQRATKHHRRNSVVGAAMKFRPVPFKSANFARTPLTRVHAQSRVNATWFLLTDWPQLPTANGVTLVRFEYRYSTYAAIPTADGWLIIPQI